MAAIHVRAVSPMIQRLEAARNQPTRTHITDAMRTYKRDVLKDVTWQKS